MTVRRLLGLHEHHWGVPHERARDRRLVMTCYGCGAEHELGVDLRPDGRAEHGELIESSAGHVTALIPDLQPR